ncbi:DUF4313 domain-containing protein [Collinsella tanakaei]|uniref:DUF4313 domain-containing protein n=1 Tax=Collinsella tanakaei TaxID=626935 RepID=UPI00195CE5F1|nr:DUF4313 domain-containing protein [Collinsella tanakaei]MBM6778741.1 DUF4313 domain-containing protein [Collinsella tanakaei]
MATFGEHGRLTEGGAPECAGEMPVVEYVTGWGERVMLAVCADGYERGGGLALVALNVTDPDDEEGYLEIWNVVTVNLPGDSVAAAWCSRPGHVVVDANNVPAALVDALVDAGVLELSGRSVRSGFCSYPLAAVPSRVFGRLVPLSAAMALSERVWAWSA